MLDAPRDRFACVRRRGDSFGQTRLLARRSKQNALGVPRAFCAAVEVLAVKNLDVVAVDQLPHERFGYILKYEAATLYMRPLLFMRAHRAVRSASLTRYLEHLHPPATRRLAGVHIAERVDRDGI